MMNLFATNRARLSKGISLGPVLTFAQIISVKIRHPCYMRSLSDDRSFKTPRNLDGIFNKISSTFLKQKIIVLSQ